MKLPQKLSTVPTPESLKKWHAWLAGLFGLEALALLLLSTNKTYPVSLSHLTLDSLQSTTSGSQILVPATHHLFELNMARLLAASLLIAALTHVSMATWYRLRYETDLVNGQNRLRWVALAASGGLLTVAAAVLAGMSDLVSLGFVLVLIVLAGLLGLVLEAHNPFKKRADVNWLSYVVGVIAGGAAWLGVGVTLLASSLLGSGSIPGFIYAVYGVGLVFFVAFAVNVYLQHAKRGPWSTYLFGERMYLLLGALGASSLAWLIFAGALRP
jgi:hypothetical protein